MHKCLKRHASCNHIFFTCMLFASIHSYQIYFFSGSNLSIKSILFSYIVNTIPPLNISRTNLGSAPLQNVKRPSFLNMVAASAAYEVSSKASCPRPPDKQLTALYGSDPILSCGNLHNHTLRRARNSVLCQLSELVGSRG